jgi:hypothetical protein
MNEKSDLINELRRILNFYDALKDDELYWKHEHNQQMEDMLFGYVILEI